MTPSRCCVGCDFVFAGWHGVNKSRTRSARHHRQVGAGHGIKNEVVYAVKARTHLNAKRLTGRPRDVDSKASRKNPGDKKSARSRAPQLPPPVAQKKQGHAPREQRDHHRRSTHRRAGCGWGGMENPRTALIAFRVLRILAQPLSHLILWCVVAGKRPYNSYLMFHGHPQADRLLRFSVLVSRYWESEKPPSLSRVDCEGGFLCSGSSFFQRVF